MPRPEWRDPAKERYWRRLLGRWRRSGLTGRKFCAANGVSEPSFYGWKREIARRDQEVRDRPGATTAAALPGAASAALPAFVPVTIDPVPAAADSPCLEVVLAGGRLLRVRGGLDAALLRQLLAVLEEPSC
jgi:hypothetical protein